MANREFVHCSRCQGVFENKGATAKTACPYCGYEHIVRLTVAGQGGTLRTADATPSHTAATG